MLGLLPGPVLAAQAPDGGIPLGTGAAIVQTLAAAGGDRESIHTVMLAAEDGLHFSWNAFDVSSSGDTSSQQFRYLEAWRDLADSHRLWLYHDINSAETHPGYTMHALSRATYRQLIAGKPDSMQIMYIDVPEESRALRSLGLGGARATPVRWRGTIRRATAGTEEFPLLLNGERIVVRTLHVRGDFVARQGRWQPDFWVLADSSYPLILKWVGAQREAQNVLQTTRIDLPLAPPRKRGMSANQGLLLVGRNTLGQLGTGESGNRSVRVGDAGTTLLEQGLEASCRVELPGIYFAFNSASLAPASERSIAAIADILKRHPDWTALLEGHTDSIGSAPANKLLSERRVSAVRTRLIERYHVAASRLRVEGFGAARPREPNTTIEGRARNRRVELVRDCKAGARPS